MSMLSVYWISSESFARSQGKANPEIRSGFEIFQDNSFEQVSCTSSDLAMLTRLAALYQLCQRKAAANLY